MNLDIIPGDLSASDRERAVHDVTYVWNLKQIIQVNLHTKQKDIEHKFRLGKGGGINQESGIKIYTLLYIK